MALLPFVNCPGLLERKMHSIYKQVWIVMYKVPKAKNIYELQGMATGWCYLVMFYISFQSIYFLHLNSFPNISLTLFKSFSRYIFFLGFNHTFIWKLYKTSLKFIIPKQFYLGFLRGKHFKSKGFLSKFSWINKDRKFLLL